jgi:hypothetical protein
MATQEQIDELKRKLAEAEAAVSTTPLNQQVSQLDAERARITRALSAGNRARILLNSTTLTTPLTPERRVDLERDLAAVPALEQQLASVQAELDTVDTERSQLFNQRNALREQLAAAEKAFKDATPPPASVDSAGQIAAESGQAAAEGAQTQNPQADPETLNQNGTVVTAPDTTTSSNAVQSGADPAANGVTVSAPSLPNNTSSSAGNVATTQTSPVTNTSTPASPSNTNSLIGDFGTSSATQSYIYLASKVTHHFKAGKFTQELEGRLVNFDLNLQNNTGSTQADGTAGEAEAQRRAVPVLPGPTPRQDPVVPPPAPEISNPSTPGTDADVPVNSEPLAPAETAPPTSGGDAVAVTPAPTPPSSITVAGATLQASLQISGRVFISLTLPSGKSEFNVDGWGDQQWDSLITTLTDTADITAANSLKASWPTLQAQLRASVQTTAAVAAPSQNMAKEA